MKEVRITATPNKGKGKTPETREVEGDEGENQKEMAICLTVISIWVLLKV